MGTRKPIYSTVAAPPLLQVDALVPVALVGVASLRSQDRVSTGRTIFFLTNVISASDISELAAVLTYSAQPGAIPRAQPVCCFLALREKNDQGVTWFITFLNLTVAQTVMSSGGGPSREAHFLIAARHPRWDARPPRHRKQYRTGLETDRSI